jgi:alanine dehydrogenase
MYTIGFPRMKKEPGERRVFLPDFIHFLIQKGAVISLEEGYGSRSGFSFDDYQRGSHQVRLCTRLESFQQDYILILRSPNLDEFQLLGKRSCLISMLHFNTRPKRVNALKKLKRRAISLDNIVNENNIRLVENMKAVAWNGLEVAFDQLEKKLPGLLKADNRPIQVLILGTGMVGRHAVDAATKLGNIERNNEYIEKSNIPSVAVSVGRNVTQQADVLKELLQQSDVLVDAAQRRDPSRPIISNSWLDLLPSHAVIVDLAVDPYTMDLTPPVVRGIEGIPQGNLDKYVFQPDDPDWQTTIPDAIPSACRRTVVSCYSWPGIHPEANMMHYAHQLEPLMETLIATGYDRLSPDGNFFERALYRASLVNW